jgi:hypothetical protein
MKNKRGEAKPLRRVRWAALVALGAVVALAPSPAWSQSRGQCAQIDAPWPMVLPDGSIHEPGPLRLCLQQMYTPASGLHEIRVNGATIGLFMSRVGTSEQPVDGVPIVVFQRNGTDEHYLVGYAWPDGDAMRTYVLARVEQDLIAKNSKLPLFESESIEILTSVPPL